MLRDVFDDLWGFSPGFVRPNFGDLVGMTRPYPAVNVYGNDEKVAVTSEIPGLTTDQLEINVHGRSLTIKGTRAMPVIGDDDDLIRNERDFGEFQRSLSLPFEVDPDKVSASYERGVLRIDLPRAEKDKPRKIEVKSVA